MSSPTIPEARAKLRRRLLEWFDCHKRPLPWRQDRDAYRVWLSEIMLQQTQVATVIPYYERFLLRFPTIGDLAQAPLAEVLPLWAGLGYYSRARNLHRAAQIVAADHGGELPTTIEELLKLPGVGRYTAGAIASISFGRRAAVVDGNVTRVLARLFDLKNDVATATGRRRLWRIADALVPLKRCGDHNEALMELGATVCLSGASARCGACPVRDFCLARSRGTFADRPINPSRTRVRRETHVVVALRRNGRWLCRRRPPKGLWGGLWELPSAVLNGSSPATEARALAREFIAGPARLESTPFCRFEQQLTHRRIEFVGFTGNANGRNRREADAGWKTLAELERLGISRAVRETIAHLREYGRGGAQRAR